MPKTWSKSNSLGVYALFFSFFAFASTNTIAATVTVNVNGQLGSEVLAVHAGYGGAPYSGTLEIDTDSRQIQSGTSNPFYVLTDWSITVTGTLGSMLLESSGETLDSGIFLLSRSSDTIVITIDEDINQNGSTNLDTTMRFIFDPQMDITPDSTIEDLSSMTLLPPSSLLQFSTSQAPMMIASGSATVVPIPAAIWLMGSALAGLGWIRRK